jgi:hypothetical protein
MEPVDYYKVSKLAKVAEGEQGSLCDRQVEMNKFR